MVSFRKEYQVKKIVWDGDRWRDLETGVIFNGEPPQELYHYPDIFPSDEPSQPDVQPEGWHHPFDKSYAVTYEQVQKMINDAFEQRIIPDYPAYFFEGNWLVTYDWVMHIINRELSSVNARIQGLRDRPWWKRW